MRRAAKIDANQKEIVAAFRKFGCSVLLLHSVGQGCPDIAIGKNNKVFLVEIKDGNKPPSARNLTKDQEKFHAEWKGCVYMVQDLEDVINLVKALEK